MGLAPKVSPVTQVEKITVCSENEESTDNSMSGPIDRSQSDNSLEHVTSTPETPQHRSESALLRIRGQVRAAALAERDMTVRNIPEPADVDKEIESTASDTSLFAGGAMHDMPRLADALLQKTKLKLEESRNLSKEVRDAVCGGLHDLYEMILRLADSRTRHIIEKEKAKGWYEQQLLKQEARHVASLEKIQQAHQDSLNEILENIKLTFKEAESTRWLAYEIDTHCKTQAKWVDSLSAKIDKVTGMESTRQTPVALPDLSSLREEVSEVRRELTEALKKGKGTMEADMGVKKRSYAVAASQPRLQRETRAINPKYPVIIESVDPRHCSENIIEQIKDKVSVVDLGIGINSVRKLRNSKVAICCDSEEDRNKLQEAINSSTEKLTVTKPSRRNPLIKLVGVIKDLSDTKLEDAIFKQNSKLISAVTDESKTAKVIKRTRGRTDQTTNAIVEVSPPLWGLLVNQKLRIGYQVVTALDQSPLLQCFRCLKFSHRAHECTNEISCGYCADSHDTRECPNRNGAPKCCNCLSSNGPMQHPAYSAECPEKQKWDRIARAAVTYC